MNDIINITVEELNSTVSIVVEETTDDIAVSVEEITEQINITIEDVGIRGRDGIDGLSAAEAQDIRNRLNALENVKFDELPLLS